MTEEVSQNYHPPLIDSVTTAGAEALSSIAKKVSSIDPIALGKHLSAGLNSLSAKALDKDINSFLRITAIVAGIALTTLSIPYLLVALGIHGCVILTYKAAYALGLVSTTTKTASSATLRAGDWTESPLTLPNDIEKLNNLDKEQLEKVHTHFTTYPEQITYYPLRYQVVLNHLLKSHQIDPLPLKHFPLLGDGWTDDELSHFHSETFDKLPKIKKRELAQFLYNKGYFRDPLPDAHPQKPPHPIPEQRIQLYHNLVPEVKIPEPYKTSDSKPIKKPDLDLPESPPPEPAAGDETPLYSLLNRVREINASIPWKKIGAISLIALAILAPPAAILAPLFGGSSTLHPPSDSLCPDSNCLIPLNTTVETPSPIYPHPFVIPPLVRLPDPPLPKEQTALTVYDPVNRLAQSRFFQNRTQESFTPVYVPPAALVPAPTKNKTDITQHPIVIPIQPLEPRSSSSNVFWVAAAATIAALWRMLPTRRREEVPTQQQPPQQLTLHISPTEETSSIPPPPAPTTPPPPSPEAPLLDLLQQQIQKTSLQPVTPIDPDPPPSELTEDDRVPFSLDDEDDDQKPLIITADPSDAPPLSSAATSSSPPTKLIDPFNHKDFKDYVKNHCTVNYEDACNLVCEGYELYQKLLNDIPIEKGNKDDHVKKLKSICWAFMFHAVSNNRGFTEGTFNVADPGHRLFNFFLELETAYGRPSSHVPELVQEITDGKLKGYKHVGIDMKGLPAEKRTVVLGKIRMRDRSERIYLKMENYGVKEPADIIYHGGEYVISLLKKFAPSLLGEVGGGPNMCKEYISLVDQEKIAKLMKQYEHFTEITCEKKYGFSDVVRFLTNAVNHVNDHSELESETLEYLKKLETLYPHLEFQIGNEVVLTQSSFLNYKVDHHELNEEDFENLEISRESISNAND